MQWFNKFMLWRITFSTFFFRTTTIRRFHENNAVNTESRQTEIFSLTRILGDNSSEWSQLNPAYAQAEDRELGRGRRDDSFHFREEAKAGWSMWGESLTGAGTDRVSTPNSTVASVPVDFGRGHRAQVHAEDSDPETASCGLCSLLLSEGDAHPCVVGWLR